MNLVDEIKDVQAKIAVLEEKKASLYKLLAASRAQAPVSLHTIDMARVVIRNAGRPLTPEEIRNKIQLTFGVVPAKTLNVLLSRKTRSGDRGFYRDQAGFIGLHEMLPTAVTVQTSANFAVA